MKYLLFVVMLTLGSLWSCAQSVDTAGVGVGPRRPGADLAGTAHKPTLWERRRQKLEEMRKQRDRQSHMTREEHGGVRGAALPEGGFREMEPVVQSV